MNTVFNRFDFNYPFLPVNNCRLVDDSVETLLLCRSSLDESRFDEVGLVSNLFDGDVGPDGV